MKAATTQTVVDMMYGSISVDDLMVSDALRVFPYEYGSTEVHSIQATEKPGLFRYGTYVPVPEYVPVRGD